MWWALGARGGAAFTLGAALCSTTFQRFAIRTDAALKNAHVTGKDAAKTYLQQGLEFAKGACASGSSLHGAPRRRSHCPVSAFREEVTKGLPGPGVK